MEPRTESLADVELRNDSSRPKYQVPSIQPMNESEILIAFQMSAAKIGAAGCWWAGCNNSPVEENT